MSKAKRRNALLEVVHDQKWIDFFYLESSLEELSDKLHHQSFTPVPNTRDVPFTAQIRGYTGARDIKGDLWLLKEIEEENVFFYQLCELAYYLDFLLETLSAPTLLVLREGTYYRATKVIVEATQISGYNYLEEPLRRVLANDLINRWLMFDEDRNPNNYMVIHNSKRQPLIVAIDFNHSDLEAEKMKITGNPKQFGWYREEKTRFLTLLKPENFELYSIEDFERRLSLMMGITESRLKRVCTKLFEPVSEDYAQKAEKITKNILRRREHINTYFRTWFKNRDEKMVKQKDAEYEGLGKNFVEIYKKKI